MAKRKRKTSGRSTASRRKNRTQDRMPAGLITLFAGLVLMALAFVPGSSAWRTMHDVLFGVFGCGSFVLGAALCYLAILYTRGEDLLPHIAKLVLGLIFASGTVIVFSDIPTDQTAAQMTTITARNRYSDDEGSERNVGIVKCYRTADNVRPTGEPHDECIRLLAKTLAPNRLRVAVSLV